MINVIDSVPDIERELGIEVVKSEQYVTYKQTVSLRKKECVGAALAYLQQRLHEGKVTGRVLCLNMNQGGITQVQTEQTGKIRIGSELEELTDEVFESKEILKKDLTSL
jgi:hypothetical protein